MNRISQWFLTDSSSTSEDDRKFIRERILTVVLIGAAILGVAAYYVNVRVAIQQSQWIWIFIYTLALGWVCAIAFIRRIPYEFRAVSMLIVLYALGVVSALLYGAAGDSRIWFVGAAILSCVFLGLRFGIISTLITTATYIALGWLMANGQIKLADPSPTLTPDNIDGWTSTAVPLFAISIMIVSSVGVLINGLNNNIRRSRELAAALAFDQEQLEARTKMLERRELQVRTAAEISRAVIAELDPDTLFQRVVDLLQTRFNLYYAGVFTVDSSGHYAVLRAGTGEAGELMIARNHQLAIGSTSMIGYVISQRESRLASDVGLDTHYFDNPDLPLTRSELALPMVASGKVLGAITVQSTIQDAFDKDEIVVYQGVADTLATAIENANLFQQVQSSLEEVQTLHQQYLLQSWGTLSERTQDISYSYTRDDFDEGNISKANLTPTTMDIPLVLRDQVIGNLNIETNRATLTPQEESLIDAVTQQTALALENVRLVEETQRTAQQDRIVNSISEKLSRAMDVESVIKAAVQELGRLPDVSEVSVHIDPAENEK